MTDTVSPDFPVIPAPKTARDLFLMATQGNPENLAAAVSTKPDETYTLHINIALKFRQEDVLAMLRGAGYTVDFPAANDTKEQQ